jgi:hypothetical protein
MSHAERRAIAISPDGTPAELPVALLEEIGHEKRALLSIIRNKCLDCSHTAYEVKLCTAFDCALWPYRLGKNPFLAPRSEAQIAASLAGGDRLRKARNGA